MIIRTTEELTLLTAKKVKKSGLSLVQITEQINQIRERSGKKQIHPDSVSHAIQNSKKSDQARNGIRCEILSLFGIEANTVYEIKRQKRS